MGGNRYCIFKWAATVALLSCVTWLYVGPDSFDGYWSFLPGCSLCTSPVHNRQTMIGSSDEKYSTSKETMCNSEMERKNEEESMAFNVTKIVLRELQGGFFAAITENKNNSLPLDTVCVAEPTLLECGNSGFAALLLATLDHVSYCDMLGIQNISINWKNCQTSCIKDPRINSWPAYFEPLNRAGIELNARKVLCLGGIIVGPVLAQELARTIKRLNPQQVHQSNWASRTSSLLEVGFRKRQSVPGYEEGSLITPKLRKWVNNMITKYIRPQERITSRVDEFYRNNMEGFNILGVHVRGTDIRPELEEQALPEIAQWINDTQAIFETLQEPKKIFIASDNDEAVQRFVEHFEKNKVII